MGDAEERENNCVFLTELGKRDKYDSIFRTKIYCLKHYR